MVQRRGATFTAFQPFTCASFFLSEVVFRHLIRTVCVPIHTDNVYVCLSVFAGEGWVRYSMYRARVFDQKPL